MKLPVRDEPPADPVEQASEWCARLAEGSLTPDVRAQFDRWLAGGPENRRAFEDAARVWQSLEQTHVSPELVGMRRDALENLRRANAVRWSRSNRRRVLGALAAAIAIVGIGTAWWFWQPDSYQTGIGERRVVTLSDGSSISLDTKTRVEVRYTSQSRELRLVGGRAKFQVAKNALRPFSVSAADKVVVAIGTEFSVELLSERVHVILYQGRVDVLANNSKQLRPVRILPQSAGALLPGRELVAPVAAAEGEVQDIDAARTLLWESGQLTFNDEPLSAVIGRVNRYTDSPFAIGDAAAGKVRISGTFAAGDAESFVEGVTGVFPLHVEEIDGRRTFLSTAP